MNNTYNEFRIGCEFCEGGFVVEYEHHPWGTTVATETVISDTTCSCHFGKLRDIMEVLVVEFDIDLYEDWNDDVPEHKLFDAAQIIYSLQHEDGEL